MSVADPLRPSDPSEFDAAMQETPDGEIPPEEQVITSPRRKSVSTTTWLMLGLLAAVGGATYLMILRAGVQVNGPGESAVADTTIKTFLSGGVQGFRQKLAMLANTEKTVAQFNASPAGHQVAVTDLHGNPFGVPPAKEQAVGPMSEDAARRHALELEREAATIASTLKLQSILYGTHSSCMIDGKLYRLGRGNGTFTIVKIEPEFVDVQIHGQDFELKMAPPQPKD